MSKGGGGGGSTTTVQKADPWPGLQGPLNTLYGGAVNNFQSGGPQYYPGSTVAPSNGNIESALNMGQNMAMGGPSQFMQQAQGALQRNAGGISPYSNPAYGTLAAFAGGNVVGDNPAQAGLSQFGNGGMMGMNPAQAGTQQLAGSQGTFGQFAGGQMAGQNPAQNYFQGATNGNFLDQQNPWLKQMVESAQRPVVDQFQNAIAPAMASQFSMAGRTGSGAHEAAFGQATNSLGKQLGDLSGNLYGQAYESERGRQQQAAGQLAQMGQFDQGMRMQGAQGQLGALGQLSGMNQFDQNMRMQGLNSMGQMNANERGQQLQAAQNITAQTAQQQAMQQSAALAAPQFEAAKYGDLDKLLGIGEYRQGQQQQLTDADMARYNYNQQLPGQNLQTLNQLLQGGMALNGSTSSARGQQNRNPFNSAVGGAFLANGLGSMLPGAAGTMLGGPMGMLGGAVLGGLFGG